jgi:hypothetical protein
MYGLVPALGGDDGPIATKLDVAAMAQWLLMTLADSKKPDRTVGLKF